jgi:very-short-patch-repair endonuclease
MSSYNTLSDIEKKQLLEDLYIKQKMSFADIAQQQDTYANKILRDAKKLGLQIRDKSQAQKNALKTGKHKHPTLGQERQPEVKDKIGMGVMKSWETLSEDELSERKHKAKLAWDELDSVTKENILQKANTAVRVASKKGSKLENFLLESLLGDGFKVDFHKEQILTNTKLQIDLFLPSINTAIEVDGPSHFEPVWGQDCLNKNISYDQKKQGLILGKGLVLIRVKQTKDYSKTRAKIIYAKLLEQVNNIKKKFPPSDQRIITIED